MKTPVFRCGFLAWGVHSAWVREDRGIPPYMCHSLVKWPAREMRSSTTLPPSCLAHLRFRVRRAERSECRIELYRGSKEHRCGSRYPRKKRSRRTRCGPLHRFPNQPGRYLGRGGFHDWLKDQSGRGPALELEKPRALCAQPEKPDRRRKDRKAGLGADDPFIWRNFHFQQMQASPIHILRILAADWIGTSHLCLLSSGSWTITPRRRVGSRTRWRLPPSCPTARAMAPA